MRSQSTSAFAQPRLTKPTFGADLGVQLGVPGHLDRRVGARGAAPDARQCHGLSGVRNRGKALCHSFRPLPSRERAGVGDAEPGEGGFDVAERFPVRKRDKYQKLGDVQQRLPAPYGAALSREGRGRKRDPPRQFLCHRHMSWAQRLRSAQAHPLAVDVVIPDDALHGFGEFRRIAHACGGALRG